MSNGPSPAPAGTANPTLDDLRRVDEDWTSGLSLDGEVVRSLIPDDLPAIQQAAPSTQVISKLRNSHHQLAQLLARGCEQADAALITGYSQTYISRIATQDPAFQELLAHYAAERDLAHIDLLERMHSLGLTAMEILQERLAEEPERWTNQQLMDLEELNIIKPMQRTLTPGPLQPGSAGAGGVSVSVNFVTATPSADKVIDVTPERRLQGPDNA